MAGAGTFPQQTILDGAGEKYDLPRILNLYTSKTTIKMEANETAADYMTRAENKIPALRDTGENLSDGLLVATILNGLPESFRLSMLHRMRTLHSKRRVNLRR